MNFLDVFLIGVALAMDAFALTIANCTVYKNSLTKKKEWAMPLSFGLFQFLMPVIGFYIGSTFSSSVSSAAGYITAAVFFVLAVKIVIDNLKEYEDDTVAKGVFSIKILLIQALATSIDALLIGAGSFSFKLSSPYLAALGVGAITFIIVSLALLFGKFLGKKLGKYAEWMGAVILFALAVKELIQALV